MTYSVEIRIQLKVDGELTPDARTALSNLADVMLVQAEDGLYLAGSPDPESLTIGSDEVDNAHVAEIHRSEIAGILTPIGDIR